MRETPIIVVWPFDLRDIVGDVKSKYVCLFIFSCIVFFICRCICFILMDVWIEHFLSAYLTEVFPLF